MPNEKLEKIYSTIGLVAGVLGVIGLIIRVKILYGEKK